MHIVLGILAALGAAYFYYLRAKNAGQAATELVDVANDVRLAARRFGFRRKTNVHPVESIEDPNIAIAAIATGFLELENLPSRDAQASLSRALQSHLGVTLTDAEELMVLGRWLLSECGGADAVISRASRKLYKLSGTEAVTPLLSVVQDTLTAGGGTLNDRQREALDDVRRALHIR